MKAANMPSLRVNPALREAAEAVIHKGESLSSFTEQSLRDEVNRSPNSSLGGWRRGKKPGARASGTGPSGNGVRFGQAHLSRRKELRAPKSLLTKIAIEHLLRHRRDALEFASQMQRTGSAMKIATLPSLLVDSFSAEARPMFGRIAVGLRENAGLTRLRDWLLPLLMNGQVRVA